MPKASSDSSRIPRHAKPEYRNLPYLRRKTRGLKRKFDETSKSRELSDIFGGTSKKKRPTIRLVTGKSQKERPPPKVKRKPPVPRPHHHEEDEEVLLEHHPNVPGTQIHTQLPPVLAQPPRRPKSLPKPKIELIDTILQRQKKERDMLSCQMANDAGRLCNEFRASWAIVKLRHTYLCQPHVKFSDLLHFVDKHTSILREWQAFLAAVRSWEKECEVKTKQYKKKMEALIDGLFESHIKEIAQRKASGMRCGTAIPDRCALILPSDLWQRPAWPEIQVAEIVGIYESLSFFHK